MCFQEVNVVWRITVWFYWMNLVTFVWVYHKEKVNFNFRFICFCIKYLSFFFNFFNRRFKISLKFKVCYLQMPKPFCNMLKQRFFPIKSLNSFRDFFLCFSSEITSIHSNIIFLSKGRCFCLYTRISITKSDQA